MQRALPTALAVALTLACLGGPTLAGEPTLADRVAAVQASLERNREAGRRVAEARTRYDAQLDKMREAARSLAAVFGRPAAPPPKAPRLLAPPAFLTTSPKPLDLKWLQLGAYLPTPKRVLLRPAPKRTPQLSILESLRAHGLASSSSPRLAALRPAAAHQQWRSLLIRPLRISAPAPPEQGRSIYESLRLSR